MSTTISLIDQIFENNFLKDLKETIDSLLTNRMVFYAVPLLFLGYYIYSIWRSKKRSLHSSHKLKQYKKRIENLNSLTAADIDKIQVGDYIKTRGKAVLPPQKQALIAPISKRPCLLYELVVEREVGSEHGSHWITYVHEIKGVDFIIQSDKRELIICADTTEESLHIEMYKDVKDKSGLFNKPNAVLVDMLKSRGRNTSVLGFQKKLRYYEGIVEINEEIIAVGTAEKRTLSGFTTNSARQTFSLVGTKENKLYITDIMPAAQPSA